MIAFPWSRRKPPDDLPKRGMVWGFVRRRLGRLTLYLLVAIFAAIVLWPYMVVTVPSGQVGVLWKRFGGGTVLDPKELRSEGLRIVLPWDRVFFYDLRIQSVTQTFHAIASDGIGLTATVNIRFRLRRDFIPFLHQSIGPDYLGLLGPEVASRMRDVVAHYTAEQVYSTQRAKIEDEIKDRVIAKLGERFLERDGPAPYRVVMRDTGELYDTLLQEIKLPPDVVGAINRKAEQFYVSQEYVYRIERETRESERKRIEAQGISAFQQIVAQGISDSYLRWRGIEATLELSKSNNAKIVIIGSGREGLPIILGNVDSPPAVPAPTGGAPANAAPEQPPAATPGMPAPAPNAGGTVLSPGTTGPEPDGRSAIANKVQELFNLPWLRSVP